MTSRSVSALPRPASTNRHGHSPRCPTRPSSADTAIATPVVTPSSALAACSRLPRAGLDGHRRRRRRARARRVVEALARSRDHPPRPVDGPGACSSIGSRHKRRPPATPCGPSQTCVAPCHRGRTRPSPSRHERQATAIAAGAARSANVVAWPGLGERGAAQARQRSPQDRQRHQPHRARATATPVGLVRERP